MNKFYLLLTCGLLNLLPLATYGQNIAESPVRREVKVRVEFYRLPRKAARELFLESKNNASVKESILKFHKALDAKEPGYTLLGSISVMANPGTRAKTEAVDEVIYPTEYDYGDKGKKEPTKPKENPPVNGSPESRSNKQVLDADYMVAQGLAQHLGMKLLPPSAFEMRPVGLSVEIDPVIGNDNLTIDLTLAPEIVRLRRWIIYNGAIQPVFYTRKVSTAVTLFSGEAVFLGSWMPLPEDVGPDSDLTEIMVVEADIVKM